VTASGNSKGAIEFLGQEMANDEYANALIDAGDVPAVADIETQLEGTRNAVFAVYAFGVQR
jgi:hypothetical protein